MAALWQATPQIAKRIERAGELARECATATLKWLSDNPQRFTREWDADREMTIIWSEPLGPPPDLSIQLSECVHHWRAALDESA